MSKKQEILTLERTARRRGSQRPRIHRIPHHIAENSKSQSSIPYKSLQISGTDTLKMSLMPQYITSQNQCVLQHVPNNHQIRTILDATAHVGIDTINFAIMYPNAKIIAVESNKATAKLLSENTKTYKTITAKHANGVGEALGQKHDIVYLDPPWGDNYKEKQDLTLRDAKNNEISMSTLIRVLLTRHLTKCCILKAPLTYIPDDDSAIAEMRRSCEIYADGKSQASYILYFYNAV